MPDVDAWGLLQSTLDRHLGDPELRTEARSHAESLVDPSQLQNLSTVLKDDRRSYRDAALIQLAYAVATPGLDVTRRQMGARSVGQKLGLFLKGRHVTAVQDAFQNIGKNSRDLVRGNYPQFDAFLTWAAVAPLEQLRACFEMAAATIAATARPIQAMPTLDVAALNFAAVMGLYEELLATPSGGAHEQYIVGSLLDALLQQNRGLGYRVETKRLNASDKSAGAAGDIQIMSANRVIEAFEVTANDWRTKTSGVSQKLREHDLSRVHVVAPFDAADYIVVARELLAVPEDISVLELHGFIAAVVAALTHAYRSVALARLHEYLDRFAEDPSRVNAYVALLQRRQLAVGAGE